MDNLRVAILGTRGFPNVQGGVEKHCEELYTRLASMGCRVRVYARKAYVGPDPANYKGVEIFPLWAPRKKTSRPSCIRSRESSTSVFTAGTST
jgi:hypothetical protein